MLNHPFKPILCSYFILLLIAGCDAEPQFTDNKTINVTTGKSLTASINVSNWNDDDQLVLLPGGPYKKNYFPITQPAKFIQSTGQYVIIANNQNHIIVIDFSQQPARQIAEIEAGGNITAMCTHDNLLLVGFKQAGLTVFDLSALPAVNKIAQLDNTSATTRIKLSNNRIFALIQDRQLKTFTVPDSRSTQAEIKLADSIDLPAPSTDFAIVGQYAITIGPKYGVASLSLTDAKQFQSIAKLQNPPKSIHIADDVAYVADGKAGLALYDVSDPRQLRWLGSHNKFDSIDNVFISNQRAFVLDHGLRLATLNLNNRHLPITGSFYKPTTAISNFIVQDDQAFLATRNSVDQIVFPVASHTQISNEGINQGGSRRAFIENNIAYVADWFSGLHLYDISDPTHIRHLSNYHTPGSSKGVVVENGYAYVGDDDHGLQIVDVSNPKQPKKVSSIMTTGLAYTLKKQGNLIFLADHRGGFYIIDVADVKNPRMVSNYDTPGKSWAIDVVGNTAYVADDTTGLLVFDVSNTKQPRLIGQFNPQGAAEDVVVKDHLAYVSFFDKGFYILDVSNPAQIRVVAQLPIPGNARSVDIQGNYAYIAGWESGLNIVDISNISAPTIVGRYDTKGSAWGANIDKHFAFVWDWWGGILAIDIKNPQRPQLAGRYHARGQILNLRQKKKYIYTANGEGGVQVFDINNALNPIWTTGIDFPGRVVDIWPSEKTPFAFAANAEHGLQVLDITNPFYISSAVQYDTGGNATLVREYHNMVFVANKPSGLVVFDATDPSHLVKKQELPVAVNDLWLEGNHLFVASTQQGLLDYRVDDRGQVSEKFQMIDNNAEHIIAQQALLVSSTGNNEIKIWQINDDGIQLTSSIAVYNPVIDIKLSDQQLLINSADKGLLSYDISNPDKPLLQIRYPATDILGRFIVSDNAVFFGGTHTITSVQRLAPLSWKSVNPRQLEITIPPDLELGHYHLQISNPHGYEYLWPNAISVELPARKKPKITMDDFKKLLEKHRAEQQ